MKIHRPATVILLVLTGLLTGLVQVAGAPAPRIAPREAYDPPRWERMTDLAAKAERHEQTTLAMVDEAGLLLYYVHLPWTGRRRGGDDQYLMSHHLADAPAWQGYLMAALGFKAGVLRREASPEAAAATAALARVDADLARLGGAYHRFYEISGEAGLFGNSMLPGYDCAEPLPWMLPVDRDKPWFRSEATGEWWRDGVNKGHYNLAVIGCAIPLALERRGEIELDPATRDVLVGALVPMVTRLVDHDYRIRDRNGRPTQHSDLRPNILVLPNGFQRTIALNALASAAPYDESIAAEYERRVRQWTPGIAWSMSVSGCWSSWRGRWNRWANLSTSDVQAFALAACSFLLQEPRAEYADEVRQGLAGWWRFMQHELNVPYTTIYARFVEADDAARAALMVQAIEELRDFPPDKIVADHEDETRKLVRTPGIVQPIANRRVDSNYWKSDPYRKITASEKRIERRIAGMDYLLAYWMARYFGLIEAN